MPIQESPTISVFITCYSEGELLLDAVASLEQQTDQGFEYFVINDDSPDEATNKACDYLEKEKNIRVVRRSGNGGLAAARNSGFEMMSGSIAVPLDADDTLPPGAIEAIREGFQLFPDADYLFGNYTVRDLESDSSREMACGYLATDNGVMNPRSLAAHWRLLGTSPCTKALWQRIEGYRLEYSNDLQDKDFWIRALLAGGKGYYLDENIYTWNRSSEGMNSSVSREIQDKLKLDHLDFFLEHWECSQALNELAELGQFEKLQRYARSLLQEGVVSARLLFIAKTPCSWLKAYYESGFQSRLQSLLVPGRRP